MKELESRASKMKQRGMGMSFTVDVSDIRLTEMCGDVGFTPWKVVSDEVCDEFKPVADERFPNKTDYKFSIVKHDDGWYIHIGGCEAAGPLDVSEDGCKLIHSGRGWGYILDAVNVGSDRIIATREALPERSAYQLGDQDDKLLASEKEVSTIRYNLLNLSPNGKDLFVQDPSTGLYYKLMAKVNPTGEVVLVLDQHGTEIIDE